jgi:hypothetical protein
VSAAWGARLIVDQTGFTDFVHDRQGAFGDESEMAALFAWLNMGSFDSAREKASVLLRRREMDTRGEREFVLYEDDKGKIVGNTNASAGYLYVAAWLKAHDRPPEPAEVTRLRENLRFDFEVGDRS